LSGVALEPLLTLRSGVTLGPLLTLRATFTAWALGAGGPCIDVILPERAGDAPEAVRMDLHMLILFGARERTAAGFRELLATAGLALRRVVPTGAPDGLAVIEAAPA